jgi:hypothetical protein
MYINPLTKIYSSFTEAKEDFDKYGHLAFFDDRISLTIADLAKGNRNLIVGEPGIGKTKLLEKFQEHHNKQGDQTCFINLRSNKPVEQIENFLPITLTEGQNKILLLDGLDETQSTNLIEVIQKIESISKNYPDLIIYLSSRWIFINKYANSFPNYRFMVILPFTGDQVRNYLTQAGHTEKEVDELFVHVMQFSHRKLVLQIPRYLFYFEQYIKEKSIKDVRYMSRNDLFEYFIYSKLDLEEKNLETSSIKEVIKRVLEKLALTMEIYQTNNISKEELMTFFDDVKSDLKLVVLSQINLETFIAKTILQPSAQDLNRIEFENTEFQEYLAAKEITRFDEPHRVTFNFAADDNINEIHPSWFNTLTFLVDLLPGILEQLLEFSGITNGVYKIADDSFLDFLSRINPTSIPPDLKHRIFVDVLNYHERTLQWLPGQLTSALPNYFTHDLEMELKNLITKAETKTGANRYVLLGNTVYIVAYLLRSKIPIDSAYWREKLIAYSKDKNENGVLQRHALYALEEMGDPTIIDELPDLSGINDELISREFLSTCVALNPDNPKSLRYAIDAVRRNNLSGRYGLFKIKNKSSIAIFLKTYNEDEQFRKEFLDDTSIFKNQDLELVSNITEVFDAEIEELCKQAVVQSVKNYLGHTAQSSVFILGVIRLLKEKDSHFLNDLLPRFIDESNNSVGLYFAQDFLAEILDKDNVSFYLDFMIEKKEINSAMTTMMKIKFSKRDTWEMIYEAGRLKLPDQYTEWETAQNRDITTENRKREKEFLKEFRNYLEPAPGQYITGVFNYYVTNADKLNPLMEKKDKKRLKELIINEALKHNPAAHGLKIETEHEDGSSARYTASRVAQTFGDAFLAAKKLGIDITPYRQNIALHIPFAYPNELEGIFELIKDFTSTELAPVVEIYKGKNTDLWRHRPESFINLVERYHIVDAVPVLREFVREEKFNEYQRKEALQVAVILSPDITFLKEIFNKYINSDKEDDKQIAYTANGLLITLHADKEAISWRLKEIKNRAIAFVRPQSGHAHMIGPEEEELRHGKPFAKPLTELKSLGFEEQYLEILDSAIEIWSKGSDFHTYAQYMWEIVYAYFENLKVHGKYTPLKLLEKRILALKDKDGANWLASSMVKLRRSYLYKPSNISEAIRKYNEAKTYSDKKIQNSADLFVQLQNAIETDLRTWIEGEGAYSIIVSEKKYKGNSNHEELVQKTIKTQLHYILMKGGFRVDITREEQLLDGKRTDLIVRYGFVGPIILEIKLSSSGDIRSSKIETTSSYISMGRYMSGYGASHGIFLIIDNTGKIKHINRAKQTFVKIPNVFVTSLDCYSLAVSKTKTAKKVSGIKKNKKKSKKDKNKKSA